MICVHLNDIVRWVPWKIVWRQCAQWMIRKQECEWGNNSDQLQRSEWEMVMASTKAAVEMEKTWTDSQETKETHEGFPSVWVWGLNGSQWGLLYFWLVQLVDSQCHFLGVGWRSTDLAQWWKMVIRVVLWVCTCDLDLDLKVYRW